MSRNYIITIVALVFLIAAFIALLFDVKKVPDYSWMKTYSFASDQPFDLKGFKTLLEKSYKSNHIEFIDQDHVDLIDTLESSMLLVISPSISMNADILYRFLSNGNDLMLVSDYFSVSNVFDHEYEVGDSLEYLNDLYTYVQEFRDTCFSFVFNKGIDSSTYCNYSRDLDKKSIDYVKYFIENKSSYQQIVKMDSTKSLCVELNLPFSGRMYLHTNPDMFCNINLNHSYYFDYYNFIVRTLGKNKLYVTSTNPFRNHIEGSNNPLQYILSEDGLKHAYFTMLGLVLLYFTLGTKRKQKAIPIIKKVENTSLSYVDVLSDLYIAQNQNEKLIKRLEKQFYHFCKKKYFLDYKMMEFYKNLAKKSGIDESYLVKIQRYFDNVSKGFEFNDKQLYDVNAALEYFYHNCK